MSLPYSQQAEEAVVGQLLAEPRAVPEVIGTGLDGEHFWHPCTKMLFERMQEAYYADEPIGPLITAEPIAKHLKAGWGMTGDPGAAVDRVKDLAAGQRSLAHQVVDHAQLVKRDADYRALLDLAASIERSITDAARTPEVLAGEVSQTAMEIATSTLLTREIVSFEQVGRDFLREQQRHMEARRRGIELGAYFGLEFLDKDIRGLQPGELFILAGEPGAGKSAVSWVATRMFAERQMEKPSGDRIAALVMSLEMGARGSATRVATSITTVGAGKIREAKTSDDELREIAREWGARKDIPLYFNFTSSLRTSQLRALVTRAVDKHNVGLVIVDHMRYFEMDRRFQKAEEEDEAKAKFLSNQIAKELNVAVILLAHTTKAIEQREGRRPRLSDLRGGGLVAAHADFVGFVHRPYNAASQEDIDAGKVKRTDAEMIWGKSRWTPDGVTRFHFDASTQTIK